MTDNKTKLQTLARAANRQAILRMLKEKKNIEQIAIPFDIKGEGGIEFILAVLEAALLPEKFENLPAFNFETHELSDEMFERELAFLNLPLGTGLTGKDLSTLTEHGFYRHWQVLSAKDLPELEEPFGNPFSFAFEGYIMFPERQYVKLLQ